MTNYLLGSLVSLLTWAFPSWLLGVAYGRLRWGHISRQQITSLGVAALTGYLYFIFNALWFALTPQLNPVYSWLIEHTTQSTWFRPLVQAQDLVQQFVIALPFAWLLLKTKPRSPTLALLLFVLPAFFSGYSGLIANFANIDDWSPFVPGIIFQLTLFPIVYVSLYKLSYSAARKREK